MSVFEQMSRLGWVTWHSSDEGSGPDVGISIGLGNDRALWIGEISRDRYQGAGNAAAALGTDDGWWLMLYTATDAQVIAKFVDTEAAREFSDLIEELDHVASKTDPGRFG